MAARGVDQSGGGNGVSRPEPLNPKAVLFDMDDTLYPELDYVASGFKAVARFLEAEKGWMAEDSYAKMTSLMVANGRGRVFNDLLTLHDVADTCLVSRLVGCYRSHAPDLELFAGVSALLTRLKDANMPMALVTDGLPKMQHAKITALGLGHWFRVIILPWELDAPKPKPDGFRVAAAALGVAETDCLIVGDRSDKDGAAARAMGSAFIKIGDKPRDPNVPVLETYDSVSRLNDRLAVLLD